MPVFTGIGLALGALATAAETTAAAVGTAAAAGGATAATGGVAAGAAGATGAGIGASLGAGSIGGASGLLAGAGTGALAGGATAAAPLAAGASVGNIATTAGLIGTGVSVASQGAQLIASQQAAAEQQKQEALRQKQMNLEADRQRREVIRQTQISQAMGINNAANSGGAIDSSVLSGIVGQNSTNAGYALGSINENESIGNALFASNAAESRANSTASLFGGVSNIGKSIADNNMQIGRLGSTLFNG